MRAWHGSPYAKSIEALRPSSGGELGPGLYFSRDFNTAKGYMYTNSEDGTPNTAGVLELDLHALNIAQINRQDWLDRRSEIMDKLRADNNGEWKGEFFTQAMKQLIKEYEDQGIDGLYDDWRQGVVFPNKVHLVKIV